MNFSVKFPSFVFLDPFANHRQFQGRWSDENALLLLLLLLLMLFFFFERGKNGEIITDLKEPTWRMSKEFERHLTTNRMGHIEHHHRVTLSQKKNNTAQRTYPTVPKNINKNFAIFEFIIACALINIELKAPKKTTTNSHWSWHNQFTVCMCELV